MEEIKLVKFKGSSDYIFQYGCIYEVMKIIDNTDVDGYFETYIKDTQGNIRYTPYSSQNTFLENWEAI